jgi:hypothetical protein
VNLLQGQRKTFACPVNLVKAQRKTFACPVNLLQAHRKTFACPVNLLQAKHKTLACGLEAQVQQAPGGLIDHGQVQWQGLCERPTRGPAAWTRFAFRSAGMLHVCIRMGAGKPNKTYRTHQGAQDIQKQT